MTYSQKEHSGVVIRSGLAIVSSLVLCALLSLASATSVAAAPKQVVTAIPPDGVSGITGGRFDEEPTMAVNHVGGAAGDGDIYAAESYRVQQFDSEGNFIRAWGLDVVQPGGVGNIPVNEVQSVELGPNTTGGTFTLSWDDGNGAQETVPIAFDAPASGAGGVGEALEGLSNVGPGDVAATGPDGGPWRIEFTGALADRDVSQIRADGTGLAVSGGPQVAETVTVDPRGAAVEVCTVAAQCQAGVPGSTPGSFESIAGIALDQTDGSLWVMNGASPEHNGRLDKFDASGDHLFGVGRDVIPSGQPGDESEIQTVTVDATGGTFTLSMADGPPTELPLYRVTEPIPYDASAQHVQAAIDALNQRIPGGVAVSGPAGGPWVVEFSGRLANQDVEEIKANGDGLTGGAQTVSVATTVDGQTFVGIEKCTSATGCKGTVFDRNSAGGVSGAGKIAVDPRNGDVLLAQAGRFHRYNSDGSFDKTMGWDVVPGPPEGLESCTSVAPGACKRALVVESEDEVALDGEPGKLGAISSIAIDSTGAYYASDPSYYLPRTQKFNAEGTSAQIFAPATLTGTRLKGTKAAGAVLSLAVDPVTDNVYALRTVTADEDIIGTDVRELTSSGSLVDVHATVVSEPLVSAVAAGTSGRIYLSKRTGASPNSLHQVLIAGAPQPPQAIVDPATGLSDTTVTLNGRVNPNGFFTDYRFEYRRVGASKWKPTPVPDALAGSGGSLTAVSQPLDALQPGSTYQYRLVAIKRFGGGQDISDIATFSTDPAPPRVQGAAAFQVGPGRVELRGLVDPQGTTTSYRFEYGTADCASGSCTSVPIPDGDAGSAPNWVEVSETVDDLQQNVLYHFRLVAVNDEGGAVGPDTVFELGIAPPSSPERAYEQVSPSDKNGVEIGFGGLLGRFAGTAAVTGDGERVAFTALGPFADIPVGCAVRCDYLAERTAGGWRTHGVTPRPAVGNPSSYTTNPSLWSADLSRLEFFSRYPLSEGDAPGNYLLDLRAGSSLKVPSLGNFGAAGNPGAASDDLGQLAYDSTAVLTGDGQPASGVKAYVLDEGQVRLAGVLPNGTLPKSSAVGGFFADGGFGTTRNAVSDDGRYAFFSAPAGPQGISQDAEIYRRDLRDNTTTLVSPSKRAESDPAGPFFKSFEYATPDGRYVFFRSPEKLTDDSTAAGVEGMDLYRYDVAAGTLIDLSVDRDGDDSAGAQVEGLLANTPDGRYVYYVAKGEVVEGGVPGELNLYLWRDDGSAGGESRFIATLGEADSHDWATEPYGSAGTRTAAVSDNGRLLFSSVRDLTDHGDEVTHAFTYDPFADGGDGLLECVSCKPDGEVSDVGARVPSALPNGEEHPQIVAGDLPRPISADGSRIFFESGDSLVPEDINGKFDVYEWHQGEVVLISTGTDTVDNEFMGAGEDGRDVFFRTRQKLLPTDGDTLYDIYDARAGGGFAISKLPPCEGEECRPEPQQPPTVAVPSSGFFQGGGNVTPPAKVRRCRKGQRKVTRRGKLRCVSRRARVRRRCARAPRAKHTHPRASRPRLTIRTKCKQSDRSRRAKRHGAGRRNRASIDRGGSK